MRRLVALLLGVLVATAVASGQQIGNYVPPKKALRLELAVGKKIYAPGEAVKLVLRFVNEGSEALTFTEPADYQSGLALWRLRDGPPEEVKRAGEAAAGAAATLEPGKALERTIDLGAQLLPEAAYEFGWRYGTVAADPGGAEFRAFEKARKEGRYGALAVDPECSLGLWGEPDPKFKLRQFLGRPVARMTTCAIWSEGTLARLRNTRALLDTSHGPITLEFFPELAPVSVTAFQHLVRSGSYDGRLFHRIIKGFMMQGGDPRGDGTGDAGYKLAQEFSDRPHAPGTLSMARQSNPDSAGCQFFICFGTPSYLDGAYTVFGRVAEGMEAVKAVEQVKTFAQERPVEDVVLRKATLVEAPAK